MQSLVFESLLVLLRLDSSREALNMLHKLFALLLVLAREFCVLLVAHLRFIACLHLDLFESVQLVARFLDLTIDVRDLVFNRLALCLISLICQAPLVNLIAVVDYLRVELDNDCGQVL